MTQTSLHTKYRPTTFKGVVGHKEIVQSIKKVVNDRRQHSFILTGQAGIGKTTLARIIAHEICGEDATDQNIIEIPAANYTGVDSIREISDKSRNKALGAVKTKVFIFDEAHRLSRQAWDALLKIIEEPPQHVYWVFVTTEVGKIPATIKSRCTQYDLASLNETDLEKIVKNVIKKEGFDIADEVFEVIIESSGGSARTALVNLEKCIYCETGADARSTLKQAGADPEVIDFARFLLNRNGRNWSTGIKILNKLDGKFTAESIRMVVVNYMASMLINTTSEKKALPALEVLDAFSESYNESEKFGPLLLSLAAVVIDD